VSSGLLKALPGKGIFRDPVLHSRNLSVLLLSKLPRRAGVFSGLDSAIKNLQTTHPPKGAVGFLVAGIRG
jgi:hypothetical protein